MNDFLAVHFIVDIIKYMAIIMRRRPLQRAVFIMGILILVRRHLYVVSPHTTFWALLALRSGKSLVTGDFPSQRPVARNFDVFFDFAPEERFSKQSRSRWFKTPSRSLWRHCNAASWFNCDQLWTLCKQSKCMNIFIIVIEIKKNNFLIIMQVKILSERSRPNWPGVHRLTQHG